MPEKGKSVFELKNLHFDDSNRYLLQLIYHYIYSFRYFDPDIVKAIYDFLIGFCDGNFEKYTTGISNIVNILKKKKVYIKIKNEIIESITKLNIIEVLLSLCKGLDQYYEKCNERSNFKLRTFDSSTIKHKDSITFPLNWTWKYSVDFYNNQDNILCIKKYGKFEKFPIVVVFGPWNHFDRKDIKIQYSLNKFDAARACKSESYELFYKLHNPKNNKVAVLRGWDEKSKTLKFTHGRYFDYLNTNLSLEIIKEDKKTLREHFSPERKLLDLDQEKLTNTCGINSIYFTSDKVLIYQKRNHSVIVNPNQLGSTLSGVLNFKDVEKINTLEELNILREESEEIGIKNVLKNNDYVQRIILLGLTRELIRAKTELFFSVDLKVSYNDLFENHGGTSNYKELAKNILTKEGDVKSYETEFNSFPEDDNSSRLSIEEFWGMIEKLEKDNAEISLPFFTNLVLWYYNWAKYKNDISLFNGSECIEIEETHKKETLVTKTSSISNHTGVTTLPSQPLPGGITSTKTIDELITIKYSRQRGVTLKEAIALKDAKDIIKKILKGKGRFEIVIGDIEGVPQIIFKNINNQILIINFNEITEKEKDQFNLINKVFDLLCYISTLEKKLESKDTKIIHTQFGNLASQTKSFLTSRFQTIESKAVFDTFFIWHKNKGYAFHNKLKLCTLFCEDKKFSLNVNLSY